MSVVRPTSRPSRRSCGAEVARPPYPHAVTPKRFFDLAVRKRAAQLENPGHASSKIEHFPRPATAGTTLAATKANPVWRWDHDPGRVREVRRRGRPIGCRPRAPTRWLCVRPTGGCVVRRRCHVVDGTTHVLVKLTSRVKKGRDLVAPSEEALVADLVAVMTAMGG